MPRTFLAATFASALACTLGAAATASASCDTLATCAIERAEEGVADAQAAVHSQVAAIDEMLEPYRGPLEATAADLVGWSRTAVAEAQHGMEVACDLQGIWSSDTELAEGHTHCVRANYGPPTDPRNGVSEGTFSFPLIKRYIAGADGCAFALASPDYGDPNAYGTITQPTASYNVHLMRNRFGLGANGAGVDGNNASFGGWYDSENNTGANHVAYALNAEPATILEPSHTTDCTDTDLFVNAVVVLTIL
jgi:hypothetical protein